MAKWLVERRLSGIGSRLRSLRDELAVADEQFAHMADDADDHRVRALVSETQAAGNDFRDAQRHAEALGAHRARLREQIAELERRQDELLDQLTAGRG